MPQIPIYTQNQVLQAGNPVPIGSPDNTAGGMMGKAVQGLGNSIVNLSAVLAREAAESQKEMERNEALEAVGRAKAMMLDQRAQQSAAGIEKDDRADGFSGVERFQGRVKDGLNAIADTLSSPRARAMFRAGVSDDIARESQMVWAGEIDKREKTAGQLQENYFNQLGNNIRLDDNPGRALVTNLAEAKIQVMNSNIIPTAQKPAVYEKIRQDYVQQAINGKLERNDFNGAKDLLSGKVEGSETVREVLGATEVAKATQQIDEAEWKFYGREHAKQEHQRRAVEREGKQIAEKAESQYIGLLAKAGNNQHVVDAIRNDIMTDPRLNSFPELRAKLASSNKFMETADDKFENTFWDAVGRKDLDANHMEAAESLLRQRYQSGDVSADRYGRVLKALDAQKQRTNANPQIGAIINEHAAMIKAIVKPNIMTDPTSGITRSEYSKTGFIAAAEYRRRIAYAAQKGPLEPGTISSIADSVVRKYTGRPLALQATPPGVAPIDTLDAKSTFKTLENATKLYKMNQGKLSPKEKETQRNKIRHLNQLYERQLNEELMKKVLPPVGGQNDRPADERE